MTLPVTIVMVVMSVGSDEQIKSWTYPDVESGTSAAHSRLPGNEYSTFTHKTGHAFEKVAGWYANKIGLVEHFKLREAIALGLEKLERPCYGQETKDGIDGNERYNAVAVYALTTTSGHLTITARFGESRRSLIISIAGGPKQKTTVQLIHNFQTKPFIAMPVAEVDQLKLAEQVHWKGKDLARRIIRAIPTDVQQFSEEQYTAIYTAGALRDGWVAHYLVPFATIKYTPPDPVVEDETFDDSLKSRMRELVRNVALADAKPEPLWHRPFKDYPAAEALLHIRSPGPIVSYLENNADTMKPDNLEFYAKLLARMLSHRTISFLEEERRHSRRDALHIYDKLFEMRIIKQSKIDFWRGGPIEPQPDPFGPAVPEAEVPNDMDPFGPEAQGGSGERPADKES